MAQKNLKTQYFGSNERASEADQSDAKTEKAQARVLLKQDPVQQAIKALSSNNARSSGNNTPRAAIESKQELLFTQ